MNLEPIPKSDAPGTSGAVTWIHRHFMWAATVFLLLMHLMTYLGEPYGPPIIADGAGYYAYLPSLFLYGDPSFETDAQRQYGGEFPAWTYVRRYPATGRYLNSYPMGVAMMMTPFFLAGHALTYGFGWPWDDTGQLKYQFAPDGYSFFYQRAAGLSGVFYALVGLALIKRLLDRLFPAGAVAGALAALLLGTNLLFYAGWDTVNAHAYTFFLAAAMMTLTDRWCEGRRDRWTAVALGAVLALLVLTRPVNLFLCLWAPVFAWARAGGLRAFARFLGDRRGEVLAMAGGAAVMLLPQALWWKYSTGRWLVNSYQHVSASIFGWPDIGRMLLGLRRGLLVWFPILILAAAGWRMLRGEARVFRWPVLVVSASYLLFSASNRYWITADGFGCRVGVDIVAFQMIPLAALYAGLKTTRGRGVVAAVSLLFVAWSLFLLTLVYRREVPFTGLTAERLFDIFWWRWKLVHGRWLGG